MTNLRGEAAKALSSRKGCKTNVIVVSCMIDLIKLGGGGGGLRQCKWVCVAVEHVYSVFSLIVVYST
jgi:hypothetical protein